MLAAPEGSANVRRSNGVLAAAAGAVLSMAMGTPPPAVHVTFADGHVSLTATDATAAQILAEWSRVGGTRIVNADRITGPPLRLELTGVLEMDALAILLRATGGFVAAARVPGRSPGAAQLSSVEQITVLPVSSQPSTQPASVPAQGADPPGPQVTAPVFDASAGQRVIGPDGQPVPDDQDGAPPSREMPAR